MQAIDARRCLPNLEGYAKFLSMQSVVCKTQEALQTLQNHARCSTAYTQARLGPRGGCPGARTALHRRKCAPWLRLPLRLHQPHSRQPPTARTLMRRRAGIASYASGQVLAPHQRRSAEPMATRGPMAPQRRFALKAARKWRQALGAAPAALAALALVTLPVGAAAAVLASGAAATCTASSTIVRAAQRAKPSVLLRQWTRQHAPCHQIIHSEIHQLLLHSEAQRSMMLMQKKVPHAFRAFCWLGCAPALPRLPPAALA